MSSDEAAPLRVWTGSRRHTESMQQGAKILLVEDLDIHLRVELLEASDLAVLLGDEFLAHRGQLYVQVELREVEIGREVRQDVAFAIPMQRKRTRLILPLDAVVLQYLSCCALAGMSERYLIKSEATGVRTRRPRRFVGCVDHPSRRVIERISQSSPEHPALELIRQIAEFSERLHEALARLGRLVSEGRQDNLSEERGLTFGERLVHA